MRYLLILFMAIMLLAGCTEPQKREAFDAKVDAIRSARMAFARKMESVDDVDLAIKDKKFQADTSALLGKWRDACNELRYMDQPVGSRWARVWPMVTDAMDGYTEVIAMTDAGIETNNIFVLMPVMGKLNAADALMEDVYRILNAP